MTMLNDFLNAMRRKPFGMICTSASLFMNTVYQLHDAARTYSTSDFPGRKIVLTVITVINLLLQIGNVSLQASGKG